MDVTNRAPSVPIADFKRTKIVTTLGPASNSFETITELIKTGANGLRLNFSHGTHEQHGQHIKWIRQAAKALGKPVAIIADLQGPKIRLGDFEGIINVQAGHDLNFKYNADYERSGLIPLQYDLSKKVKRGEKLLLFDGKIRTTITSVQEGVIHTRAENDGILIRRKGINVPDTNLEGDIITEKDKQDLAFIAEQDVDWVALSFVQAAGDIRRLRTLLKNLGATVRVIAKIETKAAVDNLDEIVREADGVMIARGDLAVETMPEAVPIAQRQIIELGRVYAKPSIVATQMLASMTEEVEPTRAEVSDIATAVMLGADAVMLSEETASGRYPIEAVKVMKRVINFTQSHVPLLTTAPESSDRTRQKAISSAVLNLADQTGATAIVAETKSGATALQIASRRPNVPLIAVTSVAKVAQQLAIVYGVKSYVRPDDKLAATKLTNWLHLNKVLKKGDIIISASGQYPGVVGTTDTIKVRVL